LLLSKFRLTHPVRALTVGGDAWEFVIAGGSDPCLVILPGAGGTAEVVFEIVSSLEARFRVISIGYPASVATAEQLITGVREILNANGIERAFLAGHSLGGLVAQAFAVRHPERVQGLVLANTGFYRGPRAWILPAMIRAMAHAPDSWAIRFTRAQLDRVTRNAEARDFWQEYFDETMSVPEQAARQKNQAACMTDLLRFFRRNPVRPDLDWVRSMPVLAIESADDRGFTKSERIGLRRLYPRSTVHEFPRGVGHASFIVRPKEFSDTIARFVEGG
jgi:pimeloyl-ACP methyl ester carboxylesterase